MQITVVDGCMNFGSVSLKFGESYEEIRRLISTQIDIRQEPGSNGRGYMILEDIEFYGLQGKATLYFQNACLSQVGLSPEWNKYDLLDGNGKRIPIDLAVEKIAKINESELKKKMGEPTERSQYGNAVYDCGSLAIMTTIPRSGDHYSVLVKEISHKKEKQNMKKIAGYALAPKRLVENKLKVRFLYREEPDDASDSGWRFFSGDESDEFVNDPENIGLYDIETISQIDPDIIPLLNNDAGTAFERTSVEEPFHVRMQKG